MSPTPFQRLCRCRCQCCYHFFFRYSLCARDCTALITHPFASVTPHKFSNAKAMAVSVVHESQCNFPRNLQRHVFCGAHPTMHTFLYTCTAAIFTRTHHLARSFQSPFPTVHICSRCLRLSGKYQAVIDAST